MSHWHFLACLKTLSFLGNKLQYVASVGSGYQHQHHINISSSTHYLGDKNRFDVSSKGPSSELVWGGRGKHTCFYTSEYIKTTRDKIKTNQMDLIKTRNK